MDKKNNAAIIFESFYEALQDIEDKSIKADIYDAICMYSLFGEEPELTGIAATLFKLMKPNIDKTSERHKANKENGNKGGRPKKETEQKPKQNPNKTETKPNQNPNETQMKPKHNLEKEKEGEKEKEKETEVEIEKEVEVEKEIIETYENEIGILTPAAAEVLCSYLDIFPVDVITLAIKKASLSNKRNTNYIKGILNSWDRKNLHTVLDIENEDNKDNPREEKEKLSKEELIEEVRKDMEANKELWS